MKRNFTGVSVRGICTVIQGLNDIDETISCEIIDFNSRFLNNVGLRKVRKHDNLATTWIDLLK